MRGMRQIEKGNNICEFVLLALFNAMKFVCIEDFHLQITIKRMIIVKKLDKEEFFYYICHNKEYHHINSIWGI